MFYLLGSTGASVLWALLTSLALVFVVRLLHDKQKKDIDKIHKKRLLTRYGTCITALTTDSYCNAAHMSTACILCDS